MTDTTPDHAGSAHRDLTGALCAALIAKTTIPPRPGSSERRRWHQQLVNEASSIADMVFGAADSTQPAPLMIEATISDRLRGAVAGRLDLTWTLGADSRGGLLTDSWDNETPHLLIAGGSGSGKSTLMHSMLCQLLHNNTPDDLKIWILEPKNEMHAYRDIAHIERFVDGQHPVPYRACADLLNDAVAEMTTRYETMTANPHKPHNITEAAEHVAGDVDQCADLRFARLVIVIEECANYFTKPLTPDPDRQAHSEILAAITTLAQQSRAAGIHLVLSTQYPTKENLPTTLKQQCRRIGLSTSSLHASRLIIDQPGLETLIEPGTGMYKDDIDVVSFRGLRLPHPERDQIIASLPQHPGTSGVFATAM